MFCYHRPRTRVRQSYVVLILTAVLSLLLSGCGAAAQPKVYRVGILGGTGNFLAIADGFKAKMAELGYTEGKNIVYDLQGDKPEQAGQEQSIAQKFVEDKVDLIFSINTGTTVIVKAVTEGTNVPVVFAYVGLEGNDLVKSVREPGGNMTGVRYPGPEQITKRLEILLEMAPQVERVWVGYDKNSTNTAPVMEMLRPAAAAAGVTLVEVPATTMAEIEADLAARAAADDPGIDAIILMPDGFNHSPAGWEVIKTFAIENKVLLAGSFQYTVEQGALFGNADNFTDVGELAAPLADKVLKGIAAGTIPVLTPEQELYINYKLAQELGLTAPEGLLRQATNIIR